MGRKLYVGNLSFSMTEQQLSNQCSQHGSVESAKIIIDRDTNRSKGFAFVEMSTASEAQDVIANLNGFEYEGRAMKVNEAKPMESRDSKSSFGRPNRNNRF